MSKEEKQYGLKPIELKLLSTLQDTYYTNLSNLLSFVAIERLAYAVTEQTRFRVEDGHLFITEEKVEEEVATGDAK
jgi:hypothetical protein